MRGHTRPARSLGTGGAQPSREPERSRPVRTVEVDGGAERRPRLSLRACAGSTSAEASLRAKSEAQRSVGAESCRIGNGVCGRLGAHPYFGVESLRVAIRLTGPPWVKAASLTRVQTLPF